MTYAQLLARKTAITIEVEALFWDIPSLSGADGLSTDSTHPNVEKIRKLIKENSDISKELLILTSGKGRGKATDTGAT